MAVGAEFLHGNQEHLFFAVAMLAFLLPIMTRESLHSNSAARTLVLTVAGLIVIAGLPVEAAGAIIDHGVNRFTVSETDGRDFGFRAGCRSDSGIQHRTRLREGCLYPAEELTEVADRS